MPKTIRELYEELSQQVGNSPEYQEFLQAVAEAEALHENLHTPDAYGRVKVLKAPEIRALQEAYRSIGALGERAISAENNPVIRNILRNLTALAGGNHRAVSNLDPETNDKSLPEVLESVRTITLDTRNVTMKAKVGGNLNSRQPVTFMDDKGNVIAGVFTPKTVVNVRDRLDEELEKISQEVKDPEGKEMVKNLAQKFLERKMPEYLNIPKERQAKAYVDLIEAGLTNDCEKKNPDGLRRYLQELYDEELKKQSLEITDKIPKKIIGKIAGMFLDKMTGDVLINVDEAEMQDGARIDTRNAAMSAVADLLGVSRVIARAKPMKLILQDGSEVEGTFMEEAKGMDVKNLPPEAKYINENSIKAENAHDKESIGNAMKDIADIQILDYICGNVDRHGGNIMYRFDENHKICGAQAFDNDCSFGEFKSNDGSGKHNLPALSYMKAIPLDTYVKIVNLKPEELRFTLRGYGLSERELQAAGQRLLSVQNKLKADHEYYRTHPGSKLVKGKIAILTDDQWKRIKYENLFASFNGQTLNVFSDAYAFFSSFYNDLKKQKKAYQSLKSNIAIGQNNRAISVNQSRESEKAESLKQMVDARTKEGHSSPEYDAMQAAVAKYAACQRELAARIQTAKENMNDPDAPLDSVVTTGDLLEMQRLSREMKEKAEAYLAKKGDKKYYGYTGKRVQIAKLAKELGAQGETVKPEEFEIAEQHEREALYKVNRRVGDKLEEAGVNPETREGAAKVFDGDNIEKIGPAEPKKKEEGPEAGINL